MDDARKLDARSHVLVAMPRWQYERLKRIESICVDLAYNYQAWQGAVNRLDDYEAGDVDITHEEVEVLTTQAAERHSLFEEFLTIIQETLSEPVPIGRMSV